MNNKAIVFTVYNRVDYFSQTLNAWAKVKDLDQFDIYFRVEPSDKLRQIGAIIKKFKKSVTADIYIEVNNNLFGNSKNSYTALDEAFKKYNFVVLAEDDIIPSADIANFFVELDNMYGSDQEVASVGANHEEPGYSANKVTKFNSFPGLIWGTWKDQWEKYFRDTWDFAYDSAEDGIPGGWDWNLSFRVFPKNNLKAIVPHASRSQHIGVFGTHSNEITYQAVLRSSFKEDFLWDSLEEVPSPYL